MFAPSALTDPTVVVALAALAGLVVTATALLRGWNGWLALKTRELDAHRVPAEPGGSAYGVARIEMADLKERVRHLEAIASGVDL